MRRCLPSVLLAFAMATLSCQADAKTVTLRFASYSDPISTKIKLAIFQEFNKLYPNIHIQYDNYHGMDYRQKMVTAMAAGAGPDVMWCGEETEAWAKWKFLKDITPFVNADKSLDVADYYPSVLNAFKSDGKYYGFPKDFSSSVFYVNKGLFSQAGVQLPGADWTWNDMAALGHKLTRDTNNDGKPESWGLSWNGGLLDTVSFCYVWQAGGEVFNKANTECLLGNKEAIKALDFMSDLVRTKAATLSGDIRAGKLAMFQSGRWEVPDMRPLGDKGLDWDVVTLPRDKEPGTIVWVGGYGIASTCKHPKEAWEFLKFLTGVKAQQIRSSMGQSVPARQSVANSDFFLSPKLRPSNAKAFLSTLSHGHVRPTTYRYEQAKSYFQNAIVKVLQGKGTASQLMPQAAKDTTRFLQRK